MIGWLVFATFITVSLIVVPEVDEFALKKSCKYIEEGRAQSWVEDPKEYYKKHCEEGYGHRRSVESDRIINGSGK